LVLITYKLSAMLLRRSSVQKHLMSNCQCLQDDYYFVQQHCSYTLVIIGWIMNVTHVNSAPHEKILANVPPLLAHSACTRHISSVPSLRRMFAVKSVGSLSQFPPAVRSLSTSILLELKKSCKWNDYYCSRKNGIIITSLSSLS